MKPNITNNPMHALLRDGKISEFNTRFRTGEKPDLTNCDFRSVDLRGLEVTGIDFRGSYFRQADLRGVDLS
ncbi:MAG: pentapeptide repeat-containing protein, partial [Nitrospirota bacterium]|nr:pentapeptide repeat-containing protein [Nitrospirota bacterium]